MGGFPSVDVGELPKSYILRVDQILVKAFPIMNVFTNSYVSTVVSNFPVFFVCELYLVTLSN